MSNWPKLSETLPLVHLAPQCGRCGALDTAIQNGEQVSNCQRWREHDDKDAPTDVIVYLCEACGDEIINPHPRLYSRVAWNEVTPGKMGFCLFCDHFNNLTCKHPALIANGGPGLKIDIPKGSVMFFDGVRNGKRVGWSETIKPLGSYVRCHGRKLIGEREV